MVWNKTSQELEALIVIDLRSNMTQQEIARKHGKSVTTIHRIARENLSEDEIKLRYSNSCRVGKLGNKNPMLGKSKMKHHMAKEETRTAGYLTVFFPSWWEGGKVRENRAYKHHIVWAEYYGQTSIPKGCVIHHIDCNKDNNDITNLQLLTVSEHMTLHAEIRKVQRLSREGVGNSVPEAQGNQ